MAFTWVRTATLGAGGASAFSQNAAGNALILAFIAFGGSDPYTFPSTTTDTAGNTYNLAVQGSNITFTQVAAFAIYTCANCVHSASTNSFVSPVGGTVATRTMGAEFQGPLTSLEFIDSDGPSEGAFNLTISSTPVGCIAFGVSLNVAGVCDSVSDATALYTGADVMLQYAYPSGAFHVPYTQTFDFTGGVGASPFLVILRPISAEPIPLAINQFVNPDGSPVANGYLRIRLNQDGSTNDTQIQSNFIRVPLDLNGFIVGDPQFWPNLNISPPGSYYILLVYNATGQLVSGPSVITVVF